MRGRPPIVREGWLEAGGARLEVRSLPAATGGGPVLVLLHEGLGSVALWRDFPDRLAAETGCGVLVYSRAGYGRSSPVPLPRPLSYMHDEALDTLPRLLDAAGLDEVVLVGHSDGGSIALVHAGGGDPGGRVRGVVALAPHVFCEELSLASIREARVAFETGGLRAKLERYQGENVDVAFWGWNQAWLDPAFERWNIEEFLPRIRVPVLVVQGREDPYGTVEQLRRIERGCGTLARTVLLEACGHSPHRDQGPATLAAIAGFVREVGEPARAS